MVSEREKAAMKRTNIVMDERLVARAKQVTGLKTTRQLVDHALREMVRHRKQRDILKLQGKVDWEGDLAAMRRGRDFS
jgi:Arc/MetJ family transcription regulator